MTSIINIVTKEIWERVLPEFFRCRSGSTILTDIASDVGIKVNSVIGDFLVTSETSYVSLCEYKEEEKSIIFMTIITYCLSRRVDLQLGLTLGDCYFKLAFYSKAILAYEEELAQEAASAYDKHIVLFKIGRAYYFKGDIELALEIFSSLEDKIFEPEYFYLYGCAMDKNGENDFAYEYLKLAYNTDKTNVNYLRKLIYLCLNLEKYYEAIWYLELFGTTTNNRYAKLMLIELNGLIYKSNKIFSHTIDGMINDVKQEMKKEKIKKMFNELFGNQ